MAPLPMCRLGTERHDGGDYVKSEHGSGAIASLAGRACQRCGYTKPQDSRRPVKCHPGPGWMRCRSAIGSIGGHFQVASVTSGRGRSCAGSRTTHRPGDGSPHGHREPVGRCGKGAGLAPIVGAGRLM
jgi:hypothetical protein